MPIWAKVVLGVLGVYMLLRVLSAVILIFVPSE
jgi:hypothetical protein